MPMQLTREERVAFYWRAAVSAAFFLLLFSVALNVFLLKTRVPEETTIPEPAVLGDPFFSEPQAFGVVKRGFPLRIQQYVGTSAVLPVTLYQFSGGILPTISAALPLYRDQGLPADAAHIAMTLKTFHSSFPWESFGVLPVSETWRSADRTLEFVLDTTKRSLTATVLGSFVPAPEGRADDVSTIAIAERFIDTLKIDRSTLGPPFILEKTSESDGSSKTYVVWALLFDGVPLLDANAKPVPAVQVQVGRLSRKALSATMTLLSPASLSRSSYPRATTEDLVRGFMNGGLLPAPRTASGVLSVTSYTSAEFVYILLPADTEHPTYIVPGVHAVWKQPACKDCILIPVSTLLPAINNDLFRWYSVPTPTNVVPSSGTASSVLSTIKRASGSGS
jgi:hypothetical protein